MRVEGRWESSYPGYHGGLGAFRPADAEHLPVEVSVGSLEASSRLSHPESLDEGECISLPASL